MKKLIFFIIVLLISYGCKTSTDPPVDEPKEIIPLAKGNYWIYKDYYLDAETGEEQGEASLHNFGFIIDTVSVIINNKKTGYFKFGRCADDLEKVDGGDRSRLCFNNKSGFYYAGSMNKDTLKQTFNDLIFPYPSKKGDSFTGHMFYYSSNSGNYNLVPFENVYTYKCISTDSLYKTPAGEFRCMVYMVKYNELKGINHQEVYYYISPRIGIVAIVKMIYFYQSQKHHYFTKEVLTKYIVKKEN